jgi:hypothetical protein
MIFNACHSGSLQPKSLGRGDEEAPVEGKSLPGGTASALLGTGTGRIVISACKPDQLSSYEEGERLTWFTKALKDGLRGESIPYKGYINAFNLYNYVYEEVTETAEKKNRAQDPMITVLQGVGPFPVALAGSSTVRGLGQAQDLRQDSVVNAVSEEDSKGWLQKIEEQNLVMGDYVEGDKIAGDKVLGDKIGSQVITGGGAFFGGPVTAGGDVVAGDQHKTVNTEHVEGDKISVGNISGSSGVAIGRGASAVVSSGTSPAPDVVAQRNLLVVLLGSDAFKINELQALSALVGFEWATLAGDDQPGKAVALVQTAEDAGKLEDLKDKIVLLRSEFKNVLG